MRIEDIEHGFGLAAQTSYNHQQRQILLAVKNNLHVEAPRN
jgi:hypothetical protein